MTRVLALAGILFLSGCYAYLPERPAAIPQGSDVRIHLSKDGVDWIGAAYGSASGVLEGRLESWGDTVVVTTPVPPSPGMLDRGLRNIVKVRQSDIISVDLKHRDQKKTVAVSLALGGLVAITAVAIFGGVFGSTEPPSGGVPEDVRIPLSTQIIP